MKRIAPLLLLLVAATLVSVRPTWASVETDLRQATAGGRPVFLIVKQGETRGIDLARRLCAEAQQIVPGSAVVELDRGDPANAAVVAMHRLKSVPVPLILVIASNGVAAGGARPDQVTAGKLARLVPGPGKSALLKSLSEGKPAFVVFARPAMPGRAGALASCREAALGLKGVASVVEVAVDDPRESPFVAELNVDPKAADAITVVVNAKGQRVSSFLGVPTAKALADATVAKVGGCAPGSCGPGGCK